MQVVKESIHVKFNDNTKADKDISDLENSLEFLQIDSSAPRLSDHQMEHKSDKDSKLDESSSDASTSTVPQPDSNQGLNQRNWKFISNHSEDLIIGDRTQGVRTRSSLKDVANYGLVSEIEPKNIDKVLLDNDWILAIEEELNQFTRNDVWTLVPCPKNKSIIGTRWVFRKKLDEVGKVVRNKARLVAQRYNQ